MICPKCHEEAPDANSFCENCGYPLKPRAQERHSETSTDAVRCRCGATIEHRDADGFCDRCGHKFAPALPRDHIEDSVGCDLAGVSDRGLRHRRNEDDFAIGMKPSCVALVVSDGVSSASNSDQASALASRAALHHLLEFDPATKDPEAEMRAAIFKAHQAISRVPETEAGHHDPPGATIVAALVQGPKITVGWAGDSRAYWLGQTSSRRLSRDHSWMEDAIEQGSMAPEEAANDPRAHAITQCVGPLNEGPPETSVATFRTSEPGYLLLCSDGLWGYEGDPKALRERVGDRPPIDAARHLVQFAVDSGGVDNVTATLFRFPLP